jgi:5'-nucleotidase
MAKEKKAKEKESEEHVILITNDDGITAPGIRALVEAVKHLGQVVVVAPDKPQSGMGHAITIGHPLRLHRVYTLTILKLISAVVRLSIALSLRLIKYYIVNLTFV